VTTKMESSEIFEDFERALPYLEKAGYDGDQNLALVGETLDVSFFCCCWPLVMNRDGSSGGGEFSGGVEVDFSVDHRGEKRIRPPIFKGVGVTIGCLRCEVPLAIEDAQAAPRSERLGARRWCDGGQGAGGGVNGGAEELKECISKLEERPVVHRQWKMGE